MWPVESPTGGMTRLLPRLGRCTTASAYAILRMRRCILLTKTKHEATIEDLYNVPEHGKAEIVDGKLVHMRPTGGKPGRAAGKVFLSLSRYEEDHGGGYALGDNKYSKFYLRTIVFKEPKLSFLHAHPYYFTVHRL